MRGSRVVCVVVVVEEPMDPAAHTYAHSSAVPTHPVQRASKPATLSRRITARVLAEALRGDGSRSGSSPRRTVAAPVAVAVTGPVSAAGALRLRVRRVRARARARVEVSVR